MEYTDEQIINFTFFREERFVKYYYEISQTLRTGKHISKDDYPLFDLLEEYSDHWKHYFRTLCRRELKCEKVDGKSYYYAEPLESVRQSLKDSKYYLELTAMQTLTGIMLINMYHHLYFSEKKVVTWVDIRQQIEESENSKEYQRVFFGEVSPSYTDKAWQQTFRRFQRTIDRFEQLGWVDKLPADTEMLKFEIKPAIHRFYKLYEPELQNFDLFVQNLTNPLSEL